MNEKDFLQGYELKTWEFSPRIYKIIAAAAVFNLLGLLVLGQTNIMSASACESPFVKNVCSVLDTVYIGSKLLSGEKDYVVKDYNKTEINDADVDWVDTTNVQPQLKYPADYFDIANKNEIEAAKLAKELANSGFNTSPVYTPNTVTPANPTTPSSADSFKNRPSVGNDTLANRRQKLPSKIKNPVKGEVKKPIYEIDDSDENTADNKKDKDKEKEKDKNPIADKSADNSSPVTEVEINKKPLLDLAENVLVKWDKDKNLLSKNFKIKVNAKLTKDGRFDPKGTNFVGQEGDEDIVNIAKEAIEAVGNSGWMTHLVNIGIDKFELTLVQDDENLRFIVVSDQKTVAMARSKASGLNGAITLGKATVKGEDELTLLKSANVTNDGKNFILKAIIPKNIAKEILDRKLGEELAKKNKKEGKTSTQPNSKTKQNGLKEDLAK